MNIRIVKRPRGEAPEDVRDAWIGLVLPVVPRQTGPVDVKGFGVLSIPKSWLARRLSRLFGRVHRMRGYAVNTMVASISFTA
jgi:hypothetical protein